MLTWIRPVIGIPFAILIILALVLAMKNAGSDFKGFPKKAVLLAFVIAFVWCFFAGQGGFWYQSDDHWARNAIYRDLVYHPWPVVFEQYDVLLNYYVGYWLVPALFGKALFFLTHNTAGAWLVARIALLLWSTISVTICFLLLSNIFACKTRKHFIIATLFFILFSGLDILGIYILNKEAGLHIERWCPGCQYSCFSTCLFWVFNQAVPAWVATLLLFEEKRIENFAFFGLCILISSPIPLIGLFPLYVVVGIQKLLEAEDKWVIVRKIVSLQNIIACLVIFPICFIYYCDNAAINLKADPNNASVSSAQAQETAGNEQIQVQTKSKVESFKTKLIRKAIHLALFYTFEVGIYLLLLLRKKKRSLLFWCIAIELMFMPIIHVGTSQDFCMRASIPPLVALMIMVFEDFYSSYTKKDNKFIVYCIVLAFAVLTPGKEFYRGVYKVYKHKQFANNSVLSIEDTVSAKRTRSNFISYDYSDSLFYKYLAKK